MHLRLISFKLCPFVQRSVIVLVEKRAPHEVTYIDLADKPAWFLRISPRGKVPVLEAGGVPIFESAVINEFLDETHPPSMHPPEPLRRAHNRAWIEFAAAMTATQFQLAMAKDEAAYGAQRDALAGQLAQVAAELGDGPFFDGAAFRLVDAAFAPVYTRLAILERDYGLDLLATQPRVRAWAQALLARPSVRASVPEDFETLYRARMAREQTWLHRSAGRT